MLQGSPSPSLEVISISAYSRYADNSDAYYRRTGHYSAPDPPLHVRSTEQRESAGPTPSPPGRSKRPQSNDGPLSFLRPEFFRSLLPAGIDAGDLLLIVMLFLLYIDTEDEDFLIILIVMGYSMLKGGRA